MTIDLKRLARNAWRHRRGLIVFHVAVAALTTAVVFLLPRWYTASVTLVPAPKDGLSLDLTGMGSALGGTSFSLGNGPTPQDQLKMVVTSRAVADSIINRFDLVRRWRLKRRDRTRDRLAEHTTVTTPKEGQVMVSIEARDPGLARDMAAAYSSYSSTESVRLKTSLAAQRRFYLEARLHELESNISLASARVREFEEKNGAVALPEQTKETMDAAGTLQAQVALLETELAAARRYFTDQSQPVIMLRDRIDALKDQINRLARQGGTLLIKGVELPALKQQYLQLTREQVSLTEISELLRRVYEQARVEEANPVSTFSVLDASELPEHHSRPKRGLTIAIALALATLSSLGYLEWRENRAQPASGSSSAKSGPPGPPDVPDGDERRAA